MKKIYKYLFPCLLVFIIFLNSGCDILTNFSLNLPLKQGITVTGSNTTIDNSNTVYLSDFDAYSTNLDKIESITYKAALYRTLPRGENPFPPPDSLDLTPGLVGERINVTVTDGNDNLIFSRDLPTAAADDYLTTPYDIDLEPGEIALIEGYLEYYKDPARASDLSFTARITISNISAGAGPPYTLTGEIELLLEIVMKPSS